MVLIEWNRTTGVVSKMVVNIYDMVKLMEAGATIVGVVAFVKD